MMNIIPDNTDNGGDCKIFPWSLQDTGIWSCKFMTKLQCSTEDLGKAYKIFYVFYQECEVYHHRVNLCM